jgi:excisionase family DNA binding protein
LCGAGWAGMSVMDDTRRPAIEVGTVTKENTERLLTPHQVAQLFRVDPKTVARWASNGWIGSIRTPGGHRRFRESEVRALLAERAVAAAFPTT